MTAYVRDICPHCGNLRSVCSDPDAEWYPQRTMCYATADRAVLDRRVAEKYGRPTEKSLKRHATDGMSLWTSAENLSPDDDFV